VISPGVFVAPGAVVRDSIILTDAHIGPGAIVDKAIVDKFAVVGEGAHIGADDGESRPNQDMPTVLNTGLTLIGKGAQVPPGAVLGRNCVVRPFTRGKQFPKYISFTSTCSVF